MPFPRSSAKAVSFQDDLPTVLTNQESGEIETGWRIVAPL